MSCGACNSPELAPSERVAACSAPLPVSHLPSSRCVCVCCPSLSVCSKNKAVNLADTVGGTDLEKKVKGATSNEHYPTPLSQLQDIAQATHD